MVLAPGEAAVPPAHENIMSMSWDRVAIEGTSVDYPGLAESGRRYTGSPAG